ncbi:MAG: phosphate acyltransferase PlsX [Verrucomicrobiales bacterium]|nr:phosphate acyltransferase PlsX [Verrucomicrobiales bacterium]MCP5528678.1 phosphate acyltransferase PlsX [Verrucomicrobiales bacterium]
MRIAVDVMGGDHGCGVVVRGALMALQANPRITELFLVGDEPQIRAAAGALPDSRVRVIHASEVLTMEDKPLLGLRRKKDCSVLRAVELLKDGRAEALISPGNTGGLVTASTMRLRQLKGVERAAIATVIPAPENEFVLLDAGANVECRPLHLLQFAIMGSAYAHDILRIAKPRVGVLSVGTEDVKGNELTQETFKLCKQVDLHFIGNVEGHDLFLNRVDVVVCDGFVGNIVLKTCEGLAAGLFRWLRKELGKSPKRAMGALLAKGAFLAIKDRIDPEQHGGAPLLGLNGHVVIAHGSSREHAIMNAVRQAAQVVRARFNEVLSRQLAAAAERIHLNPPPPVLLPS